jgi:hypothetical protein
MTAVFVVAGLFRIALLVSLLAAGVWAYRRFRLPSIPWVLAYFVLGAGLALPTTHMAKRVMDKASASGVGPVGSSMTVGEFLASISATSSAFAAAGQVLIAWFILAELAFAYSRSEPTHAVPAVVAAPRQHRYVVGVALVVCAVAMPAFWLALLVARA